MMRFNITQCMWHYIAGFLDADGCISVQIVVRKDYTLGFQLRFYVSFTQKTVRRYHLEWLQQLLGNVGYITDRKNGGVSDYTIVGVDNVKPLLLAVAPILRLKNKQAQLALEIMSEYKPKMQAAELIRLCHKVDQFAELNDSKKRTLTSSVVKAHLLKEKPSSSKEN